MLVVSRKPNGREDTVELTAEQDVTFKKGQKIAVVTLVACQQGNAKIGVDTHAKVKILRGELVDTTQSQSQNS